MLDGLRHQALRLIRRTGGDGLLAQLSSVSTLAVGVIAAAGLSLVVYAASQGWPHPGVGSSGSPDGVIGLEAPRRSVSADEVTLSTALDADRGRGGRASLADAESVQVEAGSEARAGVRPPSGSPGAGPASPDLVAKEPSGGPPGSDAPVNGGAGGRGGDGSGGGGAAGRGGATPTSPASGSSSPESARNGNGQGQANGQGQGNGQGQANGQGHANGQGQGQGQANGNGDAGGNGHADGGDSEGLQAGNPGHGGGSAQSDGPGRGSGPDRGRRPGA